MKKSYLTPVCGILVCPAEDIVRTSTPVIELGEDKLDIVE